MTIWVHGPSAWDSVIEIDSFPKPGDFLRAKHKLERPGGSGLNTAVALASSDLEVGFITYLGKDTYGDLISSLLKEVNFKHLRIKNSDLPTLHALVLKDNSGDRTIIALEPTEMNQLGVEVSDIKQGDIFVFSIWRSEYKAILDDLNNKGVICVVGASALEDNEVCAAHVVGSKRDFKNIDINSAKSRFENIVITDAENGAVLHSKSHTIHQDSLASEVKDATGAGDSFLAGYVLSLAKGLSNEASLYLASAWAASALVYNSSLPPTWPEVRNRWGLQ